MKKYLFFLKKYKYKLIFTVTLIAVLTTLEVITPYIDGWFIDALNFTDITKYFLAICVLITILENVEIVCTYLEEMLKNTLTEKLVFDFKMYILNHISRISIMKYKKYDIAYISKKIDEDVRQFWDFFMSCSIFLVFKLLKIIATLFIIFNANILIGVCVLILTPIYYQVYKKYMIPLSYNTINYKEKSAIYFNEYTNQLNSIEEKRIHCNDNIYEKSMICSYNDNYEAFEKYIRTNNSFIGIQSFLRGVLLVISCIIGGYAVLGGYITLGRYSILSSYFRTILTSLTYFADITKNYQNAHASIKRIDELLTVQIMEEGSEKIEEIRSIDANINFGIDDKIILSNVELHLHIGEIAGVLGSNGAGKSTLSKILIGVIKDSDNNYKPSTIIFNGQFAINEIDTFYLRKKCLCYVEQKVQFDNITMDFLFREIANIETAFGLIQYLKEINIPLDGDNQSFFIRNWTTSINELSGGDRQFISIIVSLMKQGSMIIMDEPTSNLDKTRINWLKNSLLTLKRTNIILIITHDTSMKELFSKVINL